MAKRTPKTKTTGRAASEGIGASRKAAPDGPPDAGAFFDASGASLAAALKASEAMVKGMATLQQEIATFADTELKQGLIASESLRGCRDPVQLFDVHCDLARQATQRFFDEAGKLMSLAARIGGECRQPFEACTKETFDRIAGR